MSNKKSEIKVGDLVYAELTKKVSELVRVTFFGKHIYQDKEEKEIRYVEVIGINNYETCDWSGQKYSGTKYLVKSLRDGLVEVHSSDVYSNK